MGYLIVTIFILVFMLMHFKTILTIAIGLIGIGALSSMLKKTK